MVVLMGADERLALVFLLRVTGYDRTAEGESATWGNGSVVALDDEARLELAGL
jgi:hypothetical protein